MHMAIHLNEDIRDKHRPIINGSVLLHRTVLYRVFLVRCSSFNNHVFLQQYSNNN